MAWIAGLGSSSRRVCLGKHAARAFKKPTQGSVFFPTRSYRFFSGEGGGAHRAVMTKHSLTLGTTCFGQSLLMMSGHINRRSPLDQRHARYGKKRMVANIPRQL
jgi:hypothetical protein